MPTIEKVKRPKAKASKHGIKQDKVHANAGGEEFTSGKIKKAFDKAKMIKSIRSARAFVIEGDRKIEKELAKGVLNEEETKALNELKKQVEAVYQILTKQMNMLANAKGGFGDFKKDDRDVEFSEEQQRMADETFAALQSAFSKINSEYLTSPLDKQAKMERDMREITKDLKELTMFFGRSS
jgi:Na+/phosphate symporter